MRGPGSETLIGASGIPLGVVVGVVTLLAFTPEGIVVGFQIFAWAPK